MKNIIICSLAAFVILSGAKLQAQQPSALRNGCSGWVETGVVIVGAAFIVTAAALAFSTDSSSNTAHSH